MTKKDREEIKKIVAEAISDALTVEVTYEKKRDEKTGIPLATPELKKEKEYLPIWWMRYLPHYEASNRGIQETQDKQANTILKLTEEINQLKEGVGATVNILLALEGSIKEIAYNPVKQIGIKEDSKLAKLEQQILNGGSEQEKETAKEKWLNITGTKYESNNS